MFSIDKIREFEEWFEVEYVDTAEMNHTLYCQLSDQMRKLREMDDMVGTVEYTEYIRMYIRISMRTKMLELLVPLYALLQSRGEEHLLLQEYYSSRAPSVVVGETTIGINSGTATSHEPGHFTSNASSPDGTGSTPWYVKLCQYVSAWVKWVKWVRYVMYGCVDNETFPY